MKHELLSLDMLPVGEKGKVELLSTAGTQRRRMLDLGLVSGTQVEAVLRSPMGDPVAYLVRGTVIALRKEDARKIMVQRLS